MWELDYKESWALKNWCFWTVVLEKPLKSPLDCKELQPINPKGNQSWIFIGRTDAEAETPIFWPPNGKKWLTGKAPDAGKDWRQEEKGTTEDEMIGWHHWLNRHEFEQTPGVGDGQGSLACCSPSGHKVMSDFFTVKLIFFFFSCFPCWILWKQTHYMQSTLRSEEFTYLRFLLKFLFSNLLFQTELNWTDWEVIRKCQCLNKNACYIFKCQKWTETQRKRFVISMVDNFIIPYITSFNSFDANLKVCNFYTTCTFLKL